MDRNTRLALMWAHLRSADALLALTMELNGVLPVDDADEDILVAYEGLSDVQDSLNELANIVARLMGNPALEY